MESRLGSFSVELEVWPRFSLENRPGSDSDTGDSGSDANGEDSGLGSPVLPC